MRESFAYESNGLLLSHLLVPDPIPRAVWEKSYAAWQSTGTASSLLEWLVRDGSVKEATLLAALSNLTGASIRDFRNITEIQLQTPAVELLGNHGFIVFKDPTGGLRAAGGPDLPPDLFSYIGSEASEWEWVLLSPLRQSAGSSRTELDWPGVTDKRGLAERLEEIIIGLSSQGAMDIHFERVADELLIRFHEGKRMRRAGCWSGERAHSTLRLLKTWAGLSTASEGTPQDGRFTLNSGTTQITLRMSHLPTIDGESAVLRVQASSHGVKSLEKLKVPSSLREHLLDTVLHNPGLILCTGPTGSGKTTTLYGLLRETENFHLKILSIEDPVEHEIAFAVQSSVDEANGWSFGTAIRAYLRQDPDIIFLGEMRDGESAQAACRAALTGHCVLSTLHARSPEAALDRMAAWGISSDVLKETIRIVINQRLIREPGSKQLGAEFTWIIHQELSGNK